MPVHAFLCARVGCTAGTLLACSVRPTRAARQAEGKLILVNDRAEMFGEP